MLAGGLGGVGDEQFLAGPAGHLGLAEHLGAEAVQIQHEPVLHCRGRLQGFGAADVADAESCGGAEGGPQRV
ncbi:MAG: hypothetical protein ACE5K7_08380 [Phycisphaerae bacterium]